MHFQSLNHIILLDFFQKFQLFQQFIEYIIINLLLSYPLIIHIILFYRITSIFNYSNLLLILFYSISCNSFAN